MSLRFIHLLFELDKISNERKKQWDMDEIQEKQIQQCDNQTIIDFLLFKNKLNRELSRNIQKSTWDKKVEAYHEYTTKIHGFNQDVKNIFMKNNPCSLIKQMYN
jgi:hypothetical protein